MKISGQLILTSQAMVIQVQNEAKITGNLNISYGKGAPGFPLTQTAKLPVILGGNVERVPVIPSNTFRGAIHRSAATILAARLMKKGQKLSQAAWHGINCGSVHGHPDGETPTITQMQAEQAHFYGGLFGGGPRFLESAYRVDTAYPLTQELVANGIVPYEGDVEMLPKGRSYNSDNQERVNFKGLLAYTFQRRSDTEPGEFEIVENPEASDAAYRTLFKSKKADETDEGSEKTDSGVLRGINALTAIETMCAGTQLNFFLETRSSTIEQDGMLLLALREFVQRQRIGASGRLGFGRFQTALTVQVGSRSATLFNSAFEFTSEAESVAATQIEAANKALDAATAREIEELFDYSDTAKEALAKKCKSPAEAAAFTLLFGGKKKTAKE